MRCALNSAPTAYGSHSGSVPYLSSMALCMQAYNCASVFSSHSLCDDSDFVNKKVKSHGTHATDMASNYRDRVLLSCLYIISFVF